MTLAAEALQVAVEFGAESDAAPSTVRRPKPGRPLVDAARAAGGSWVVHSTGADLGGLRATAVAASQGGLNLMVRLGDTRTFLDIEETLAVLGELSVPALRERLLLGVADERAGKRLRTDCRWAPSAADLGTVGGGLMGALRRVAPNFVRAACDADDLLVPDGMFPRPRLERLAAQLRRRGSRLWIDGVPADAVEAWRGGPAYGVIVRL